MQDKCLTKGIAKKKQHKLNWERLTKESVCNNNLEARSFTNYSDDFNTTQIKGEDNKGRIKKNKSNSLCNK